MVTITRVAKFMETLEDDIKDIGGRVTYTDTTRRWHDGDYRPVYWEVEAYFPYDHETFHEIEMALDDLVNGTGWEYDSCWDTSVEDDGERGVLFERHLL